MRLGAEYVMGRDESVNPISIAGGGGGAVSLPQNQPIDQRQYCLLTYDTFTINRDCAGTRHSCKSRQFPHALAHARPIGDL